MGYTFLSPTDETLWASYHDIRRTVLFERRGHFGIYDPDHSDEYEENHFPKLLLLEDRPIGVIRIDIDGDVARFRRVAIAETCQRRGHGRVLLMHAEAFAIERGAIRAEASVAADAVGFYRSTGFHALKILDEAGSVRMTKNLSPE